MDIKELILEGCIVEMPYKDDPKNWVGKVQIWIYDGYFDKPKILVEGGIKRKEFELKDIDEAITYFKNNVFNQKNLMYKRSEVMRELNEKGDYVDLDLENDLERVNKLIKEKL